MIRLLRPLALLFALWPGLLRAVEPLASRIDSIIHDRAKGKTFSPLADDAEFLRRVTLDLAGRIPSAIEARAFLDDRSTDKRTRRIDALLAGAEYPRRMQELFNVLLMERLGERAAWSDYLRESFRANRPWDAMARDMLRGSPERAGASFFLLHPGNLVERLGKVADDKLAEELYLSVLTRRPDAEEVALVAATLKGKDRTRAIGRLAWALVASTEFAVNH